MKTVWIYSNGETLKGSPAKAAQARFEENDPEGVAFAYEVLE
jgi:hypothetical protein